MATALSARNHSVLPPPKYIVVYSAGCATFVLPLHVAKDIRGALAHLQVLATLVKGLMLLKLALLVYTISLNKKLLRREFMAALPLSLQRLILLPVRQHSMLTRGGEEAPVLQFRYQIKFWFSFCLALVIL